MLAGWTEPRLADCGDGCAMAAADVADVADAANAADAADAVDAADAADAADPWVVQRVDAKLFWHFLLIFFISIELLSKIVTCSMQIYIRCTGMALKGGYPRVWPEKGKILLEEGSWCFSLR